MKNKSFFLSNQAGFYLPYVLFLTVIVLFTVATQINIYQQDIQVTHQHLEQLRIETLNQMALKKVQQENDILELERWTVSYIFPYGTARLKYHLIEDDIYNLHVDILTSNHSERALYRPINRHELE